MKRYFYLIFLITISLGSTSYLSSQNAPVVVNYSYEPAVQHFNVPPGVNTITVTIAGAQGGGFLGGKGAFFTGICNVISPHVLSVVVGQKGIYVSGVFGGYYAGYGGGASWVYDSNIVLYNPSENAGLMAVAAGGGGEGSAWNIQSKQWQFYIGGSGGIDLTNNTTTNDSSGGGGKGGNGGGWGLHSGGGAGWLSNGSGWVSGFGGQDEANHFSNSNSNGFGGGGGSSGFTEADHDGNLGGGGGGYNGGTAGGFSAKANNPAPPGGGGGGSYLNGILVGTATASNTGNGFVTISYILPLSQVIDIYPNPNSGLFTVNGIRQEQIIEIYNCLGQKIQMLQATNTIVQVDLSTYESGVYMVEVRNADGSKVEQTKVVKIK